MKRLVLLTLICAILLGSTPVGAENGFYVIAGGGGVGTKITSLPYTITAPGFYYLAGNLNVATGNGITVNSDNVTLDLMGFCLSTSQVNSGKGIYTLQGYKNIEIRNGILTGWGFGIDLETSNNAFTGFRVIHVRVMGGNTEAIRISGGGIGTLVQGCTVSDVIGGGGISILNGNATISDNTVNNCNPGIRLAEGRIIGNNVICNTGQTGIRIDGPGFTLVDQNTVNGIGTHFSGTGTIKYGHNAGVGEP